eukprot:TRINITY_DN6178_c0_g2_i1.p1 TRINITY_DN6178_c0_g2~~TRINITY_DN6178_c0_g2_i1.p1  ORF type:complete len:301 (+),score=50.04 TRINITY_DN6178_c0_g2_i1:96-998(+)
MYFDPLSVSEITSHKERGDPWLWRTGIFGGQFGDPFIRNTDLEGGLVGPSIRLFDRVLRRCVENPLFSKDHLSLLSEEKVEQVLNVLDHVCEGADFIDSLMGEVKRKKCRNPSKCETYDFKHSHERLSLTIQKLYQRLNNLKPGDYVVVPGGWSHDTGGHAILYIVECHDEDDFSFVVCNTGEGLRYHPATEKSFPKTKYKVALKLDKIKRERIVNPSPWLLLLKIVSKLHSTHTSSVVYDVVIPFFGGHLDLSHERFSENSGGWKTQQRSGVCYYKSITAAFYYLVTVCVPGADALVIQ